MPDIDHGRDGLKPQTVEAINHTKAAGVPMIVAINKIDKPEAKAQKVREELLQHEVIVEEMGGEVGQTPDQAPAPGDHAGGDEAAPEQGPVALRLHQVATAEELVEAGRWRGGRGRRRQGVG